ncbi:hypothetical protein XENORESO_007872 [Xenotaenia resolanae]|uniref:Uncharacterized protein n=1 Tax=Xenotaenia resolanae TaxID=208358 RepID=A0ABV0X4I2_9TELE
MFHCDLLWTSGIQNICFGFCTRFVVPTVCMHWIKLPLTREALQRERTGRDRLGELDDSETDRWSDRRYANTAADMRIRMTNLCCLLYMWEIFQRYKDKWPLMAVQ